MKKYIEGKHIVYFEIDKSLWSIPFSVIRIMVLNLLMSFHTGKKQAAIIQHGQVSGL